MTMIEAALRYVRRGWPVFPCIGKKPLTAHGFLDASTDPETIRTWFRHYPAANVASPTGPHCFVLDLDVHGADGYEALADLQARYGTLPDAPTVRTGAHGTHLYFAPDPRVTCSSGLLPPGIDVRGRGGYVILPPSVHPDTGTRYAWLIGRGPADVPPPTAPDWLLAQILAHAADRLRRDGKPLQIPVGQRNRHLFRIACSLRRLGVGSGALEQCLNAINRHHCVGALSADEVAAIAASATRYAAGIVPAKPGPPAHLCKVEVR